MNTKLIILSLMLITTTLAYTVDTFTVSEQVNMNTNGGFTITITNDTVAEGDYLAGNSVYVFILDPDGLPIKQVCAFEDEENCYLHQTDAAGTASGLFYVDNELIFGENYTLQVRTAGTTSTDTFQVLEPRDLSYTANWTEWMVNNAGFIAILLACGLFLLFAIAFLLDKLH